MEKKKEISSKVGQVSCRGKLQNLEDQFTISENLGDQFAIFENLGDQSVIFMFWGQSANFRSLCKSVIS